MGTYGHAIRYQLVHVDLFLLNLRCLQYRLPRLVRKLSSLEIAEVMPCLLQEDLDLASHTESLSTILGASFETVSKVGMIQLCDANLHDTVGASMVVYWAFLSRRPDEDQLHICQQLHVALRVLGWVLLTTLCLPMPRSTRFRVKH